MVSVVDQGDMREGSNPGHSQKIFSNMIDIFSLSISIKLFIFINAKL